MSDSLAEAYPQQQARIRTLIEQYRSIGPAGTFGALMLEDTLREADSAAASGDIVRMLRSFEAMKECK